MCFWWLVINLAFLVQFLPGYREALVCERDGTRRQHGTAGEGHLLCTVDFFFLYFAFMALLVWVVVLSYQW